MISNAFMRGSCSSRITRNHAQLINILIHSLRELFITSSGSCSSHLPGVLHHTKAGVVHHPKCARGTPLRELFITTSALTAPLCGSSSSHLRELFITTSALTAPLGGSSSSHRPGVLHHMKTTEFRGRENLEQRILGVAFVF